MAIDRLDVLTEAVSGTHAKALFWVNQVGFKFDSLMLGQLDGQASVDPVTETAMMTLAGMGLGGMLGHFLGEKDRKEGNNRKSTLKVVLYSLLGGAGGYGLSTIL